MKAITICQPWASAITRRLKEIENRPRRWNYRGPILIHAGASLTWLKALEGDPIMFDYLTDNLGVLGDLPRGAIIGHAVLADCDTPEKIQMGYPEQARFISGPHCLVMAQAKDFDQPIYCRGALGLWEYHGPVPPDVAS